MSLSGVGYQTCRILIVDDNEAIHKDFATVLAPNRASDSLNKMEAELFGGEAPPRESGRNDYDVDCAFQGQEAVEKIAQARADGQPYALAFVDMRMPPGWDGVETIRHIWMVDPQVQIVVCTAYSDYSLENLTQKFRTTDSLLILKKPFDVAEVIQLANALTRKWILARQAAMKLDELERLVSERTNALGQLNEQLVQEVARRKEVEEELRKLSQMDGLTGIANRRQLDEVFALQWERSQTEASPLAFIMLDIDLFKTFNDVYGHQAGDECLKKVGDVLSELRRRPEDLAARYGGEEFAMLLPRTDEGGAAVVAEKVRQEIRALAIPHAESPVANIVTVSAGVASMIPSPGQALEQLVARADVALYRAKRDGRDRVVRASGNK